MNSAATTPASVITARHLAPLDTHRIARRCVIAQSAAQKLERRLAHQLAGRCCYGSCPETSTDGDYCQDHADAERARIAVAVATHRTKLAKERKCLGGCGTRVGRSKRGKWCSKCRKAERARIARYKKKRRERNNQNGNVTIRPDKRFKLENVRDQKSIALGYRRNPVQRYIGSGKPGQRTREEMDKDISRDARIGAEHLAHYTPDALARLRAIEHGDYTHSQIREARVLAAERAMQALNIAAALVAQLHPDRMQAVVEWAGYLGADDE